MACKLSSPLLDRALDDDVFLDEDDGLLDENELLGSRLEDELNRSIEKMREVEKSDTSGNLETYRNTSSSPKFPLTDSNDELLENIEMPSFDFSFLDTTRLVSVSTGSPASTEKSQRTFQLGLKEGSKSPVFTSNDELLDDIDMPPLNEGDLNLTQLVSFSSGSNASPGKSQKSFRTEVRSSRLKDRVKASVSPPQEHDTELYQKIEELSKPAAIDVEQLVLVPPIKTKYKTEDKLAAVTRLLEDEGFNFEAKESQNKSANMTSSPVSSTQQGDITFELLEIDEVNDSLLTVGSPSKGTALNQKFPSISSDCKEADKNTIKEALEKMYELVKSRILFSEGNGEPENTHNEALKKMSELIKCQSLLSEGNGEPTEIGSLSLSSSHRMSLDAFCDTILNLDEMNDSLLSSMHLAKSPFVEPSFDFPLPAPLREYNKNVVENLSNEETGIHKNRIQRKSLFDLLAPQSLNETYANKSRSLDDMLKDIGPAYSNNKENEASGKNEKSQDANSTFERLLAMVKNDSFMTKGNKPSVSAPKDANSTFAKLKEILANDTFCAKDNNALANTTFESKSVKCVDTTFQAVKIADTTFQAPSVKKVDTTFQTVAKGNIDTTFDANSCALNQVNETFQGPSAKKFDQIFDKGHVAPTSANDTFDKGVKDDPTADENEQGKLNITFEQGEYRIGNLNETVNLMDAEGDVFKLILDSTPQKPSRRSSGINAASTPQNPTKYDPALKRNVMKNSAKSLMNQMSLGLRNSNPPSSTTDEKTTAAAQSTSSSSGYAGITGLKFPSANPLPMANQFRRLNQGQSGLSNTGPMRALPLRGISTEITTNCDKMDKDHGTPDGVDGVRGSDNDTPTGNENASHGVGRPPLQSFGSLSSIENERPISPDLNPSRGIMTSTPDMYRAGHKMNPRSTSTPASSIGLFSRIVGMEGPAPTPISAVPPCSRFNTLSSTGSLEGNLKENLALEGCTKDSTRESRGSVDTPAKKLSHTNIRPLKYVSGETPPATGTVQNPIGVESIATAIKESQKAVENNDPAIIGQVRKCVNNAKAGLTDQPGESAQVENSAMTRKLEEPVKDDKPAIILNVIKPEELKEEMKEEEIDIEKVNELNSQGLESRKVCENQNTTNVIEKYSDPKVRNEIQEIQEKDVDEQRKSDVKSQKENIDVELRKVLTSSEMEKVESLETDLPCVDVKNVTVSQINDEKNVTVTQVYDEKNVTVTQVNDEKIFPVSQVNNENIEENTVVLGKINKRIKQSQGDTLKIEDKENICNELNNKERENNQVLKQSIGGNEENDDVIKQNVVDTKQRNDISRNEKADKSSDVIEKAGKNISISKPTTHSKLTSRKRSPMLKGKLPSQKSSLVPPKKKIENTPINSKKITPVDSKKNTPVDSKKTTPLINNVLKVNNTLSRQQNIPMSKSNVMQIKSSMGPKVSNKGSPIVKNTINIKPPRQSGINPSSKENIPNDIGSTGGPKSRLQPSLRSALQPPSVRLPKVTSSTTGNPTKSQANGAASHLKPPGLSQLRLPSNSLLKPPGSKLPGIRPTGSRLPAIPTGTNRRNSTLPAARSSVSKLKKP